MTTTTTITNPSDPIVEPALRPTRSSRGRRLAQGVAVFVVGAGLGWFAGTAATEPAQSTSEPVEQLAPAPAAEAPSAHPDHPMSADAAERWAEVERQERIDAAACRSFPDGGVAC
jgi:hypothetical protein